MAIPNPNRGPPIKGWYYMRTWPKFSPLIVQKKSFVGRGKTCGFLLMEIGNLGNLVTETLNTGSKLIFLPQVIVWVPF